MTQAEAVEREARSIREAEENISIDDVAPEHREEVRELVVEGMDELFRPLDPDLSVEEVYVCGSFAEGEASPTFSDLDIRVIINSDIDQDQSEAMADELKKYITQRAPEEAPFAFVDPQVFPPDVDGIPPVEEVL